MTRRIPSLDGLRAVSIALVISWHSGFLGFGLRRLDYGNLGVRIFFLISGFLITAILLEELTSAGRIDLRSFYVRRVARIIPAYWCFLATVALLVPTGLVAARYSEFIAALLYYSNYVHVGLALVATWSLSVEEQFYLLWPITLVLFSVSGKTARPRSAAGVRRDRAGRVRWPARTRESPTGGSSRLWTLVPEASPERWLPDARSLVSASPNFAVTGSAEGARSRASGCSSSPPARSISRGPPLGFTLRARRLDAGDPARNATEAPARLSAESGAITMGSSSSAASLAVPSPDAEISCTRGAGLLSLRTSRSSLASSVSPPTSAISGRSVRLANLMLRHWLWMRGDGSGGADDASRTDHDAAQNIAERTSPATWAGTGPDQVDQDAQHHEGQGRSRDAPG